MFNTKRQRKILVIIKIYLTLQNIRLYIDCRRHQSISHKTPHSNIKFSKTMEKYYKLFRKLNSIPRPSHHEEKQQTFCVNMPKALDWNTTATKKTAL